VCYERLFTGTTNHTDYWAINEKKSKGTAHLQERGGEKVRDGRGPATRAGDTKERGHDSRTLRVIETKGDILKSLE